MKTIGILGGLSWESSATYYALINERVREKMGGLHSAKIWMSSVDFAEFARMQREGRWAEMTRIHIAQGRAHEAAGAQLLILATNTMHLVADEIAAGVSIPFMHIVDPTGEAMRAAGLKTVGLIGTRFTMEQPFYRDRLKAGFDLDTLTPDEAGRDKVHSLIFDELCRGIVLDTSRATLLAVISDLQARGAEGVILGCTELGMLLTTADTQVPLFDTCELHARAAADWSLEA